MTYFFKIKDGKTYHCFHFGQVLTVQNYDHQKSISLIASVSSDDYYLFKIELDQDVIEERRDYEAVSESEFIRNYLEAEKAIRGYVSEHGDIFQIFQNQIQ
jgi:hypothetical protein